MLDQPTSKIAGFDARPAHPFRTAASRASRRRTAAVRASAFCLNLLAGGVASAGDGPAGRLAAEILAPAQARARLADFRGAPASGDARQIADWVIRTGDNRGAPFVIVDKKSAEVFVFNGGGRLSGAAPALLGLARGDDTAPGVGNRDLADIRPEERTTPAGRFVASRGQDLGDKDVLWVDYAAALALHPVLSASSREHRLERLGAASPLDHRITFGCINVAASFYDHVVRPAFTGTSGVVYILPETKSLSEVFASSAS